jgi:peptidoglycan/LPS O-acetylase OafA/YrhL
MALEVSRVNVHYQYLDGWRGLAILMLLVGHFFPVPGINLGTAGVNLFFVLSGFLMARILFLDVIPIPKFYRRRISRIFPVVMIFIGFILVAYAVIGLAINWAEVAAALVFLTNYFPGQAGAAVMPFGHIWSLCVEEHSYVILSLIALASRVDKIDAKVAIRVVCICCIGTGLGYWMLYQGEHLEFDRWIHSEVSAFGIFVSAFVLLHLRTESKAARLAITVPVLLLFGMALHWWSVPAPVRTFVGVSAFALAVNLMERAPVMIRNAFSLTLLRQMGLWSFSIYVWQQPIYLAVHRVGMSPFIGVALAIFAGIASYYCIERPVRLYLNRTWTGSHDLKVALPNSVKMPST